MIKRKQEPTCILGMAVLITLACFGGGFGLAYYLGYSIVIGLLISLGLVGVASLVLEIIIYKQKQLIKQQVEELHSPLEAQKK